TRPARGVPHVVPILALAERNEVLGGDREGALERVLLKNWAERWLRYSELSSGIGHNERGHQARPSALLRPPDPDRSPRVAAATSLRDHVQTRQNPSHARTRPIASHPQST